MGRLNHQTLIKEIASRTDVNEQQVAKILNAFTKIATESILSGDDVVVKNFAKFSPRKIAAKRIWYAKTKKFIDVPDRVGPKTTFSQSLLNAMRKKNK